MSPAANRRRAARGAVDVEAYLERCSGDEGLTDNLADNEAAQLLAWLRASAKQRLTTARTPAEADGIVAALRSRARDVGALIAARCYNEDPKAAAVAWSALQPPAGKLDDLPADNASAALRQVLAWEDARHA